MDKLQWKSSTGQAHFTIIYLVFCHIMSNYRLMGVMTGGGVFVMNVKNVSGGQKLTPCAIIYTSAAPSCILIQIHIVVSVSQ